MPAAIRSRMRSGSGNGARCSCSEVASSVGNRSAGIARLMPTPITSPTIRPPSGPDGRDCTSALGIAPDPAVAAPPRGVTSSSRMPPNLRPCRTMSFGHFSINAHGPSPSASLVAGEASPSLGVCVHAAPIRAHTSSIASAAARPAIICSQPLTWGSVASDCGSTVVNDTIDDSPGRLTHRRPSLPWPAVWASATITAMGGAAMAASAPPAGRHASVSSVSSRRATVFVESTSSNHSTCSAARQVHGRRRIALESFPFMIPPYRTGPNRCGAHKTSRRPTGRSSHS